MRHLMSRDHFLVETTQPLDLAVRDATRIVSARLGQPQPCARRCNASDTLHVPLCTPQRRSECCSGRGSICSRRAELKG